jgi:hypothetical protein
MDFLTSQNNPSNIPKKSRKKEALIFLLALFLAACALHNLLGSFFPVQINLEHDEAEHLHVAYLLGQGHRPFVDFIENHPTLFNHFLWWLKNITSADTVREWATVTRSVIFAHFFLSLAILITWVSSLIKSRANGIAWWTIILLSFSSIGYSHQALRHFWQIRPDWISHAYTICGLFFLYEFIIKAVADKDKTIDTILLVMGGVLIGAGNAILPKGEIIIIGLIVGLAALYLLGLVDKPEKAVRKRMALPILSFLFFAGASFASLVFLDCKLGNISVKQWFPAVISLNSLKHLPLTFEETNPFTSIAALFSLNFFLIFCFFLWIIYELARPTEDVGNDYKRVIIISITLIAVNLFATTVSNGLTWSHYFIPSFFAVFSLYVILILRIITQNSFKCFSGRLARESILIILGLLIVITAQAKQLFEVYPVFLERSQMNQSPLVVKYNDYFNEATMPSGLTYMTAAPNHIPVLVPNWGYYFMLVTDRNVWNDMHTFGLGPEPDSYFIKTFKNSPPDVIALRGKSGLMMFVVNAQMCQKVNLDWLFDKVEKDYVHMTLLGREIFVNERHVRLFEAYGWKAD